MTARIFSVNPVIGFVPFTLTGHRNALVNSFFEENSLNVSLKQSGIVLVRCAFQLFIHVILELAKVSIVTVHCVNAIFKIILTCTILLG